MTNSISRAEDEAIPTDEEAADVLVARGWERGEDGWSIPGFHMAPMTQLKAAEFEIFLSEALA